MRGTREKRAGRSDRGQWQFLVMSTGYGQMPHFMDVLKCEIGWAAQEATVRKRVGRLPRVDVEVIRGAKVTWLPRIAERIFVCAITRR
jgi:hypothetical protein